MGKFAAAAIAVIIAAFLIYAATKPDTFTVQRSIVIKASPEKIFPLIEDFHAWAGWSPFEKLDPAMTKTFTGPAKGVGAVYTWAGNKKAGEGRMEITQAKAPEKLVIKLDFTKPMMASNTTEYTLVKKGEETEVTWTMNGKNNYMSKLFQIVVSMDAMLGNDFTEGLNNLKALAEKQGTAKK